MIALNDDINFENTRVPTCLLSSIKKLKFGEQEEIDGFTDFEKVEDNFFDGAIIGVISYIILGFICGGVIYAFTKR